MLEHAVEAIVRNWTDGLREALVVDPDPARGRTLFARYREAFPIDYREVYAPAIAVADIRIVETLTPERPLGVDFYRQGGDAPSRAALKVFSLNRPISLSERVPVLENMGFRVVDERTYHIKPQDAAEVWFHDMELESASGQPIDLSALEEPAGGLLPRRDGQSGGERRLQRAGAGDRAGLARCRADPHLSRAFCARSACLIRRIICGRRCANMPALPRRS